MSPEHFLMLEKVAHAPRNINNYEHHPLFLGYSSSITNTFHLTAQHTRGQFNLYFVNGAVFSSVDICGLHSLGATYHLHLTETRD